MRVGIDARFLTHPQRGGFKTYTENLIEAISQVDDGDDQYVIYLDGHGGLDRLPSGGNFTYRVVTGGLPLVGMVVREQVLLPRHASRDDLDVFHSLCNTAPTGLPVKQVVTLHDTIQVTSRRRIHHPSDVRAWAIDTYSRWAILRSIHDASRVITVSHSERAEIVRLFNIPQERVLVTHLAANAIFRPAKPEEIVSLRADLARRFRITDPYVLAIGYEERKNIPLVIEAFRRLAPDVPAINLVIVCAELHSRNRYKALVADCGLTGRVILLGSASAADLYALYSLATAFVFPSERESFGLPPLEAISCGIPTVAMKASSLPEVLQDGALLVEGKDPARWSDAIRSVILDEGLRTALAERGLKRAAALSWKRCARETIQVYRELARG
jgi:glycosyltransferase involved in cell wall biosynthesis